MTTIRLAPGGEFDLIRRIVGQTDLSTEVMVGPGDAVYEGMVVGIHSRGNDLVVNPMKEKKLTNIRAAGSDENILLTPPIRLGLEQALEFIDADELVEVTPATIRIRKVWLKEHERKRAASS